MSEQATEHALPATASDTAPIQPFGLEKLFLEHQARVFRAAYRITGSAQDAEDVLQTVFLRLARGDENAPRSPASYLYRAAVNAALDLLRARQRRETVSLDSVERTLVAESPAGLDDSGRSEEIRARLRRALARLNARHAEVFALRYLEGYDNLAIARLLGISRIHVAVVLHRVRLRLRRDLRPAKGMSR